MLSDADVRLLVLTAMTRLQIAAIVDRHPVEPRRGRPWSRSPTVRVMIACAALRTNLTIRELAASVGVQRAAVHRIVATMTPLLAALGLALRPTDRRESWVVDGTLIPTRYHRRAARSKERPLLL